MQSIDNFLNRITMYRLVLWYLIILVLAAFIFSLSGLLDYSAVALAVSTGFILLMCWASNKLLAWLFKAVPNSESVYITALILTLLITPAWSLSHLWFLVTLSCVAMASKYGLVWQKKHIFNPTALAGVVALLALHEPFSWWVGTPILFPIVLVGGLLITRKIRRFNMIATFLVVSTGLTLLAALSQGASVGFTLQRFIMYSPLLFFATIMLTEPATSPGSHREQLIYGALVGLLTAPQVHIGELYLAPELALVIGNVFTFIVGPKGRLVLTLQHKQKIAKDTYDFVFTPSHKLHYLPGQYMEWTLPVPRADSRGNRRYFTLASSPTEDTLRLGAKFYEKPSRFKQVLAKMQPGETVTSTQLSGSFTLPSNPKQKIVMIAGGIGITPFRSQLKYLLDKGQKRDIVLLSSNTTQEEIAYQDILTEAESRLGLKVVHTLTDLASVPDDWKGKKGFVTQELIAAEIPDYAQRIFYISGPHSMVVAVENELKQLSIPRRQIKTDYFPGYA